MQILIITNSAEFFRDLHSQCRRLFPGASIDHVSFDIWMIRSTEVLQPGDIAIADGSDAVLCEPKQIPANAFAAIGTSCQNMPESIKWNRVSRNEMTLWLRELSPMTTTESINEEIVVQSTHVRLAQFRVATRCSLIPVLRDRLMRGLRDYHVAEGPREHQFCMALEESLNNAFYHGNLEVSSDLKEDGSSRFIDLAAEREQLAPWCYRHVLVTELVSTFGLWITIRDEGPGFSVQAMMERCNDPEALLASGRGLLLMRAFSDEMFFNPTGNEVTLVLYGEGQDRELPLGTSNSSGQLQRLVLAG
jgi:hypothetical protein